MWSRMIGHEYYGQVLKAVFLNQGGERNLRTMFIHAEAVF
jgi:hypothetical protein